jgi:RsiW-degrading membrane proteinase PrsW (M82 family)
MRPGRSPEPSAFPSSSNLRKRWSLLGLLLWILCSAAVFATGDITLLPTLIFLGSFLVPAILVLWTYETAGFASEPLTVLECFFIGGVLAILGSATAESHLILPPVWTFVTVGFIEEACKMAALIILLRNRPTVGGMRSGVTLGAATGLGFAAFESSGYVCDVIVGMHDFHVRDLLETEVLRGLLTPLGHGLWSAIVCGILLKYRNRNGNYRPGLPVIGSYIGVSLLHALWDSIDGIAVRVTAWLTEHPTTGPFSTASIPDPTSTQKHLITLCSAGGLAITGAIGVTWLFYSVHKEIQGCPHDKPSERHPFIQKGT